MATSAISGASTSGKGTTEPPVIKQMSGNDFLKLFMAQMQYQNPLEPMSNSEMMQQISEMSSLQMNVELVDGISKIMNQGNLLQASGMIGKTVQYLLPNGDPAVGVVQSVAVGNDGKVSVAFPNGVASTLDQIRQITQ